MILSRLTRRLAALAAILAISLQALWPLIAQAQPRVQGELVPVCSVNGITHYIELPAGRTPLEQRSSTHEEHCKLCVFGSERGAALLPQNVLVFSPVEKLSEEKYDNSDANRQPTDYPPAHPRAPPAIS